MPDEYYYNTIIIFSGIIYWFEHSLIKAPFGFGAESEYDVCPYIHNKSQHQGGKSNTRIIAKAQDMLFGCFISLKFQLY